MPKPGLRPFLPADLPVLVDIYEASIEELTGEDYSEASRKPGWLCAEDDAFAEKLTKGLTLVATVEGSPVGFIALKDNELIDLFYVHPAVAGQGVGTLLYDAVEKLAGARGAARLVGRGQRQRAALLPEARISSRSAATPCRSATNGSAPPPWKSAWRRQEDRKLSS